MLLKALYRAGTWKGLSSILNNLSLSWFYLFATILIYNQRKGFPQELVGAGCIEDASTSVGICFSANSSLLSAECLAICDRVSQCWYQSGNGQCLVGGDFLVILCGVTGFMGLGAAFFAIQAIQSTRASATCFMKVIEHKDSMHSGSITPSSSKGDVVYKDVDFKYASRDTQVLKHLNFTIRENEMIGIVGESGSGKSTILKLLMRLYAPTAGTITWDGRSRCDDAVDGVDSRPDQLRGAGAGAVQWHHSRESAVWTRGMHRRGNGGSGEAGGGRRVHSIVPERVRHLCGRVGKFAVRRTKTANRDCARADSKSANSGVGRSDERAGHAERENRSEGDGGGSEKERIEGKGAEHRES